MRTWSLTPDNPLALPLAADVRFGPTDYANDQIWELDLATLELRTTYGSRGRATWRLDGHSPTLHEFYPNYLRLSFSCPNGQRCEADIWTPSSKAIALRLTPGAPAGQFLECQVDALTPVMLPRRDGRYVLASCPTDAESRRVASAILDADWDASFIQIRLVNKQIPDIVTGDPDWDAAFALAYRTSLASFVGPTDYLPYPSFIFTRIPERGFSPAGDGSDHGWQWDGQVATEAYVTVPLIAPVTPELAKGIVLNYLAVQEDDGFIDWKPGLAGQRNGLLCIPLLAAIAWHVYTQTEDKAFLEQVYPGLNRFLDRWYRPDNDRDRDGIPEWTNTIHSAYDDQPSFVRWRAWGQMADISKVETPDLMAYLYRAHRDMERIAAVLDVEPDPIHEKRAAWLQAELETMWRSDSSSYHFRDRDGHTLPTPKHLLDTVAEEGMTAVNQLVSVPLERPNRVLIQLTRSDEKRRPPVRVIIEGLDDSGSPVIEVIKPELFSWYRGMGSVSGDTLWSHVERIEVSGMDGQVTHLLASTPDLSRQDQTLLLPLWAGMMDRERTLTLVSQTITDTQRYWRPYGLPNCSALDPAYQANNRNGSGGVWLMWNTMIGEGLVASGYRRKAAELIGRLMTAMIHTLKSEGCFREAYNPDKLEGLGDRNYLWGVAPCHLFLQTVGIRILGSDKVILEGYNPFPWPITVRQHGVTVTRDPGSESKDQPQDKVTFPDGVQGEVVRATTTSPVT